MTATLNKMDVGGSSGTLETLQISRKTGWFAVAPLDKNAIIRRLNVRYSTDEAFKLKIYLDGDTSTVIDTFTLATSKKIDFFKVGRRAKVIMVEVLTSSATNTSALEINKLEIEVDDV